MFNEYINDKNRVLKIIFPLLYIFALFINDYLFIYNTIALFGFLALLYTLIILLNKNSMDSFRKTCCNFIRYCF